MKNTLLKEKLTIYHVADKTVKKLKTIDYSEIIYICILWDIIICYNML